MARSSLPAVSFAAVSPEIIKRWISSGTKTCARGPVQSQAWNPVSGHIQVRCGGIILHEEPRTAWNLGWQWQMNRHNVGSRLFIGIVVCVTYFVLGCCTAPDPVAPNDSRQAKLQQSVSVSGDSTDHLQVLTINVSSRSPDPLPAGIRPLSLTAADFDGDGIPDIAGGFTSDNGSAVLLQRGNVDALWPNSPAAQKRRARGEFTDVPFLDPSDFLEVPAAPEFLSTGDVDADGKSDLILAEKQANELYWLPNDGHGGFQPAQKINLPGAITALLVDDVGAPDGNSDMLICVDTRHGARLMMFQDNRGTIQAAPQVTKLHVNRNPRQNTVIASGRFQDASRIDIAIASGRSLILVEPGARATRRISLPFSVKSMAAGRFSGNQIQQLELLSNDGIIYELNGKIRPGHPAVKPVSSPAWLDAEQILRAHVTGHSADDLLAIEPDNHRVTVLSKSNDSIFQPANDSSVTSGDPVAVLPMRLNADGLNDLVILEKADTPTIALLMTKPAATFSVFTTNDSGPGSFRQAILDANSNPGADEINFFLEVPPFTIAPLTQLPDITDTVTIDGTTLPDKVELVGDGSTIGLILNTTSSVIRGLAINRFGTGILIVGNDNIVEGNFLGTDPSGSTALGNFLGILVQGANNLIGGTAGVTQNGPCTGSCNAISGNNTGTRFFSGFNNQVWGNLIGTAADGLSPLGNTNLGVDLDSTAGAEIGAALPLHSNVISSNGNGIRISSSTSSNTIAGNKIGTDTTGSLALPNANSGVLIDAASSVLVSTNTIAFNEFNGVFITDRIPIGNQNRIVRNSIFSNGALGIDLFPAGVTPNDPGDDDSGPNMLQNYPQLDAAFDNGSTITIHGSLNSTPESDFFLDFYAGSCDASGNGEGARYLNSGSVTTDPGGNTSFIFTFAGSTSFGEGITATASDGSNNTSEFSNCIPVTQQGGGNCGTPVTLTQNGITISTLDSGDNRIIGDLNVRLRIQDPDIGALKAYLISPTGTSVELFSHVAGGQDMGTACDDLGYCRFDDQATTSISNTTPPYVGDFQTESLTLSAFNGESAAGRWTLMLVEEGSSRTTPASIQCWCLEIQPVSGALLTLEPSTSRSPVDGPCFVTATAGIDGSAASGQIVDFLITNGPHSGTQWSDSTDSSGRVTFDCSGFGGSGPGGPGTDTLQVSSVISGNMLTATATHTWVETRYCSTAGLPLPPVSQSDSLLNVPDDFAVGDVNVGLFITQPRDRFLSARLVSPTGAEKILFDHVGGDGSDFGSYCQPWSNSPIDPNSIFDDQAAASISLGQPDFSGRFRPENPLQFPGETSLGDWKLRIQNDDESNAGLLNCWCLEILQAGASCRFEEALVGSVTDQTCATVTLFDDGGNPVPFGPVNFLFTPDDPSPDPPIISSSNYLTDGAGQAQYCATSYQPLTAQLQAYGIINGSSFSCNTEMRWVYPCSARPNGLTWNDPAVRRFAQERNGTRLGKRIDKLFTRFHSELENIALSDPRIFSRTQQLIDQFPTISTDQTTLVGRSDLDAVNDLLNLYAVKAGPALKLELKRLRRLLQKDKALREYGLSILDR